MPVEIILGDAAEVVRGLTADLFDAVFGDPPYGIRFMGRRWDYSVPSAETWAEVLRVCKPGAPLIAFGAPKAWHRTAVAIEDGGFIPDDTLMWLFGQGKPASDNRLKPAWEPAMLFRKFFDGTIEQSVEKWGTGLLAIDACRLEPTGEKYNRAHASSGYSGLSGYTKGVGRQSDPNGPGRWPANVVLDEEVATLLDAQAGVRETHGGNVQKRHASMGYGGGAGSERSIISSSGGASRFFYCAKVKGDEAFENEHPTKKPEKLTTYLARLIRPEKPGKLLVPYCGSGSEIVGALRAGWTDIVGIDNDPASVAFARERCAAEESGTTLRASRAGQPGLFGGSK